MNRPSNEGGVEEKKEDGAYILHSPSSTENNIVWDNDNYIVQREYEHLYGTATPLPTQQQQQQHGQHQTQESSLRGKLEELVHVLFGSCGNVMEAAAMFVQGHGCRWPVARGGTGSPHNRCADAQSKPPLSIADELRRLAALEGRPPPSATTNKPADIPKFLGEDAVRSFEDDNISCISQHTLEELAHHGESSSSTGLRSPSSSKAANRTDKRSRSSTAQQSSTTDDDGPPSPTISSSQSTRSSSSKRQRNTDDDIPAET